LIVAFSWVWRQPSQGSASSRSSHGVPSGGRGSTPVIRALPALSAVVIVVVGLAITLKAIPGVV
jgi:hypothetical protein